MESLQELRGQIDEIDAQIVDLYQRRMDICEKVGDYKITAGKKVFDKQREKEKLAAVTENVTNEFYKKGIRELFEQLMSMSRKLQYQLLTKRGALGRLPFIGMDELDVENPYLDAAQKMEKLFNLNHIYNYVVVSDSVEVVREVIRDGFKTLVPTWREEIDEELKLKCWHTFETLDTICDFFELKKIYFE